MRCPVCKATRTNFFVNINGYNYYKCLYCLSLFLNPLPSSKKLTLLYAKDYLYRVDKLTENRLKIRAKSIIKKLKKLNRRGKSLLDIGSGYGFFLNEVKKQKLKELGLEPAKNLFNYSIENFNTKVINTSFENYFRKNKKTKFDFICLIHVIEHLSNPFLILNLLSKHLNKNGVLYIETPNLDSHLFNFEKQNFTFLTAPDHIFIFSNKSLELIIKKISDLEIISLTTYSYPEHLLGIIKKIISSNISLTKENTSSVVSKSIHDRTIKRTLRFFVEKIKFTLIDKLIAPIFTFLLNLGNKGSIMELYIKKI